MLQKRKKIVMYFRKERPGRDPFSKFGEKRSVYRYFFQKGSEMGFDMYLASGSDSYAGDMRFKNPAFFDGTSFSVHERMIRADAIYDRSGGIDFPLPEISPWVLNCSEFKILCNDKNMMYQYFGQFMPKSFKIETETDLKKFLKKFDPDSLVVLKPAKGLGGKGIIIKKTAELGKATLEKEKTYVLQEFIDTSCGIKGITEDKHDLRVIIANGKIVLSHLRTPKEGSLLANAAQGGTLREIPIEKIPSDVLTIVLEMQSIIDKKFHFPIYSIDFGVTKNGPLVFELNDQIGFPRENMKNAKFFIDEILKSLQKLTLSKS